MKITAYPEDTSPANNDLLLTVDVSNGANKKVTVTNLINTIADIANLPVNGWYSSTSSVSSVTYNGNRSYDLVTGTDLSSTLSAGMRLRTTRTVSAPTQCTSLNGSNQYFNKTSPNKLAFTDDFVVSAWVKLNSYGVVSAIASRYDGTNGWQLRVETTGQVYLGGNNGGGGNWSRITSYQSIPLNKWVHIAAQLDMSAFTNTTTTSYIMIDGINVPAIAARSGTNPTALIQAGNLEIGSDNGARFFDGKIAQVAVFSAKVTQATMQGYISQGLSGSETNLASAYSFDNSITDLNTTTPNDLTAQNSATATNADSPFGNQADGTISASLDYGIIQKVSGTTLTVQVAEGNTIPTSGGVSSISYSNFKAPYGFPAQRGKWRLETINVTSITAQSNPVALTWYATNLQIVVPIGGWAVGYEGAFATVSQATQTAVRGFVTLGTSSATESDSIFTSYFGLSGASGTLICTANVSRMNHKDLTASETNYLSMRTNIANGASLIVAGDSAKTVIFAENAYL